MDENRKEKKSPSLKKTDPLYVYESTMFTPDF
jgi:hypothetical protein